MPDNLPSSRVEALTLDESILFDLITEHEERRKSVGELQDTDSGDKTRQVADLGDGGGNDKCDAPIKRDHDDPADLARLGGETGEFEKIDEKVIVDDFEADVSIQNGRDETGDQFDGVGDHGPGVIGNTLVSGVDGELALEGVDEETEEHVEKVDKELREKHPLPEIERAFHLGHELDKQHRTAVRVDSLHEPNNLEGEGGAGTLARGRHDGLVGGDAFVLGDGRFDEDAGVGDDAHGEEDDEEIQPDGGVGEPAEALKRADLAEEHAGDGLGNIRGVRNRGLCGGKGFLKRGRKGREKDIPRRNTE